MGDWCGSFFFRSKRIRERSKHPFHYRGHLCGHGVYWTLDTGWLMGDPELAKESLLQEIAEQEKLARSRGVQLPPKNIFRKINKKDLHLLL